MQLPNMSSLRTTPTGLMATYKKCHNSEEEPDSCPITYEDFVENQAVWRSPNNDNHMYEPRQVYKWFMQNRWQDPLTRLQIDEDVEEGPGGLATWMRKNDIGLYEELQFERRMAFDNGMTEHQGRAWLAVNHDSVRVMRKIENYKHRVIEVVKKSATTAILESEHHTTTVARLAAESAEYWESAYNASGKSALVDSWGKVVGKNWSIAHELAKDWQREAMSAWKEMSFTQDELRGGEMLTRLKAIERITRRQLETEYDPAVPIPNTLRGYRSLVDGLDTDLALWMIKRNEEIARGRAKLSEAFELADEAASMASMISAEKQKRYGKSNMRFKK